MIGKKAGKQLMRSGFIYVFFGVFMLVYGLLCDHIGLRGWQYLFKHFDFINRNLYWTIFWIIALSYVAARLGANTLPYGLRYGLTMVGVYWLAAMFYLFQLIVLFDLIRLFNRWLKFLPATLQDNPTFAPLVGAVVLIITVGLIVFGSFNAKNPVVQHYDVHIDKRAGDLQELHVVVVSDIHLGEINHNGSLTKMVDMINRLYIRPRAR